MKKPNFFIIGAPKCGTTSLAKYLSEHEEIFLSDPKEPFFFNTDLPYRGVTNIRAYLKLFEGATDKHKMVGEASTSYLFSADAVKNIIDFNPDSRFIVMVRNPVQMAYSLYSELLWIGIENVKSFREAWFLQGARKKGLNVSKLCRDPTWLQYKDVCSTGAQLERLYQVVGKEKVLVILFDDFVKDTRTEYAEVLNFLRVTDDGRVDFERYNENKVVKSKLLSVISHALLMLKKKLRIGMSFGLVTKLMRSNVVHEKREKLDPGFVGILKEEFRGDVCKLASLIDRDLSNWLR